MCEEKSGTGFMADLADAIAVRLRKRRVPADDAAEIGVDVADEIRRLWGGVKVYLCKTDGAAIEARAGEIYGAWRQEGITLGVVRRFGLSEERLRQIVALERRKRRQPCTEVPLPMLDVS